MITTSTITRLHIHIYHPILERCISVKRKRRKEENNTEDNSNSDSDSNSNIIDHLIRRATRGSYDDDATMDDCGGV